MIWIKLSSAITPLSIVATKGNKSGLSKREPIIIDIGYLS